MTTFLMNPTISPLSIYYVTINNKENAVKLSEILVQKKLVACVNIIGNNESPINSVFSWKGKQEIDNEILMIMKSRTNLLPEIYSNVKENHPYDVLYITYNKGPGSNMYTYNGGKQ